VAIIAVGMMLMAVSTAAQEAQRQKGPPPQRQSQAQSQAQPAPGQPAPPAAQSNRDSPEEPANRRAGAPLPPEARSEHAVQIGGAEVRFSATVGALRVGNPAGRELGDMGFIAYVRAGLSADEARRRPVVFAFNGGPGSASTWLHLGALGPWRLPLKPEQITPSATAELLPNEETWLTFADVVFIDPVGTGYSRIAEAQGAENGSESARRFFYSVNGDAESVADFIQTWLRKYERLSSPKVIVGESYGGIRAPKVVHLLDTRFGVGIGTMILISPVLDFEGRSGTSTMQYAALLPSLAASHLERQGKTPSRDVLGDAERYARSDYLVDLLRGPRDAEAVARVSSRVATLTGLKEDTVRKLAGRVGGNAYIREVYRERELIASSYDSSVTGLDPNPYALVSRYDDPFSTGLLAPMTSAMIELYGKLGYRTDRRYLMLGADANRSWQWGNSTTPAESVSDLRAALALDTKLHVLVAHGFTDLVTPYGASAMILDQLPAYGNASRVALKVYPGGHMFYARDPSRIAFRRDAQEVIVRSREAQGN
jgi:carboxypeptidase C (cathepsin A)